jgi:UDP-N-acetylmuramate--alanine ligase
MSGIAELLVNLGYPVSGSDLATNPATRRLKKLGAVVHRGHAADQIADADVVVVSSAVREDNPEVAEARRRSIPVIPRAEMLAELMRVKHGVAIAGAHGKTTTTGMVAEVLTAGKLDPTVVIGGRFGKLGSGATLGRGEILVAEADESDGSFLRMNPTIAVVTNIDREHLDHYRDLDEIQRAFRRFLSRVPFYGAAIVCLDEPNTRAILPGLDRKLITFGIDEDADVRATELRISGFTSSFTVHVRAGELGRVTIRTPGRHQVYNALAAIAVGLELDVPFDTVADALGRFGGVDRRMQLRGEAYGARIIDDYGHHPTEIRATLAAIREAFDGRIVVVFQPHRFSRTRALLDEFGQAFSDADRVFVTDIYAAGETPIKGLDGQTVARALVRHGHPSVVYEPLLKEVPGRLGPEICEGDVILTLGAGDVWKVGEQLIRAAKRRGGNGAVARGRRSA